MGHYDLYRMGWQQFEHLVQALAKTNLGNGVRPFGSGTDGQRDASFNGRVNFPIGDGPNWDGYGVVQAKHREQRDTTTADWRWFISEARNELRKWETKKLHSKKVPRYLLFATNVALTGGEDRGGKDQFEALMTSYAETLGLEGWYVWDYSEIRTMLDADTDIRRRYLEQIIVGDVLEQLYALLPQTVALDTRRLAGHAATELINRQWVRTGDVGYGDGSKVRLADIAIDLPCELGTGAAQRGRLKAAQTVLAYGDRVFNTPNGLGPSGVVLVGGPGQGKSTLAQLIAHTYRVAFLSETSVRGFGEKAHEAYIALRSRLGDAGVVLPQRRRWPMVLELSKLGAAISRKEGAFSLLEYIADQVVIEGHRVSAPALLTWMMSWPVCLVLDGLDEVADARVRADLVGVISTFVAEANARGIDLFIIGTSRPQGYRGEFGDAVPAVELKLVEFTESEALAYSEALTKLRSADDPYLADQVTERLLSAVHERVTQKLMTTPLQVTIMTALAEEAVQLPSDRFELFDRYYKVVYDREVSKSEGFEELRTLRTHINFLHESAGLKLQQRAELPSGSDPTMSRVEIRRILGRQLAAAGFDEAASDTLADNIVRLSMERLVLLVSRRPGKYEFDVRSLQEHMAARALTTGEDEAVLSRLARLLPSSHWRNTWLLAAGRLLKRREHLKERIVSLVVKYDEVSTESRETRLGADLAGDLYTDDFGVEYPGLRRDLLSSALAQFSDTAEQIPGDLLMLAAAAHTDEKERSIMLEALHATANENLSSLAAYFLSQSMSGMTPLAKQARITLVQGRKYVRPSVLSPSDGARHLAALLAQFSPDDSRAEALATALRRAPAAILAGGSLPAELLDALEPLEARRAVIKVISRTRRGQPATAQYATDLLRLRASRVPVGDFPNQELSK